MCFTSIGKLAFLYRVEKLGKGWEGYEKKYSVFGF